MQCACAVFETRRITVHKNKLTIKKQWRRKWRHFWGNYKFSGQLSSNCSSNIKMYVLKQKVAFKPCFYNSIWDLSIIIIDGGDVITNSSLSVLMIRYLCTKWMLQVVDTNMKVLNMTNKKYKLHVFVPLIEWFLTKIMENNKP